MDRKTVIVTGVGGNVGQGIIRNIRASGFPVSVIGTNISDFSAGNHLCDRFFKVPYARDAGYIDAINTIVSEHNVDLIIPATDFEVFALSKHREQLSTEVMVSKFDTAAVYLDKYKTYLHFKQHDIPFATSYLPEEYQNEFSNIIVKPRMGRGSRGISINPTDVSGFDGEEYMIQELLEGVEITTAFYITKKGGMHGFITFERILENGTTTHCKVVSIYDEKLKEILEKIISVSDFQGSINVQSIVSKTGEIVPFELNCRVSGTNSIRANFGFKDVEYLLSEWLYHTEPAKPNIKKGVATRILMDVIYSDIEEFSEAKDKSAKHYLY